MKEKLPYFFNIILPSSLIKSNFKLFNIIYKNICFIEYLKSRIALKNEWKKYF